MGQFPDGIFAALPTPFDEGGRIDQKALDYLVDYLSSRDLQGVALLTEVAEDPVLQHEERKGLIASVAGRLKGKKPFVVHLSAIATREAVELAKLAHARGAAGLVLAPLAAPGVGYRELYRHLDRLAKATELPVAIAVRADNAFDKLTPEEMATLAKHPALRGVFLPEAPPSAIEGWAKRLKKRDGAVLTAASLAFHGAHRAGATGAHCGAAVVGADQAARLYSASKAGHDEQARQMEKKLAVALELLGPRRPEGEKDRLDRLAEKIAARPLSPGHMVPFGSFAHVKESLKLLGMPVKNRVRSPYEPLSSEQVERLRSALRAAEILT